MMRAIILNDLIGHKNGSFSKILKLINNEKSLLGQYIVFLQKDSKDK